MIVLVLTSVRKGEIKMSMLLQGVLTTMIFTALLMGILLIPLLHAVAAYDRKQLPGKKHPKYAVLLEVDEPFRKRNRR
jgi:hypothetical protein